MSRCIICRKIITDDEGIELETTAGFVCSDECKRKAIEQGDF